MHWKVQGFIAVLGVNKKASKAAIALCNGHYTVRSINDAHTKYKSGEGRGMDMSSFFGPSQSRSHAGVLDELTKSD